MYMWELSEFEKLKNEPELQAALKREDRRIYLEQFQITSIGERSDRADFINFLNKQVTGYELPWKTLRNDFLVAKHELTLISGYTGEGKTDFVNQILLNCVANGAKGFIASLELMPHELRKRILRQATGIINPTDDYMNSFFDNYEDTLFFKDTRGVGSIDKILEGCECLHKYFGVDVFVFDNLMMLDSATDNYNKQFENAQKISAFCKTYPVSAFLVAHSRKPPATYRKPEELTHIEPPSIYDVHGASSVANLVDNLISVAINTLKQAALRKQAANCVLNDIESKFVLQGDTIIKRDKKREQGNRFKAHLYFNQKFCRFTDFENEPCQPFVNWSKQNAK